MEGVPFSVSGGATGVPGGEEGGRGGGRVRRGRCVRRYDKGVVRSTLGRSPGNVPNEDDGLCEKRSVCGPREGVGEAHRGIYGEPVLPGGTIR